MKFRSEVINAGSTTVFAVFDISCTTASPIFPLRREHARKHDCSRPFERTPDPYRVPFSCFARMLACGAAAAAAEYRLRQRSISTLHRSDRLPNR